MTRPVSVVLPSLDDVDLFEQHLPALLAELERRSASDEVLVVDDTGHDVLAAKLAARFPAVRVVAQRENGGFARALLAGIAAARHELVFALNPDVLVRRGFLDPLVACMEADVAAVVPRILLNGQEERLESFAFVRERNGFLELDQPALAGPPPPGALRLAPVTFAVGGACLLRRAEFLAAPFDPLFEPFYWEDVDWCWRAWRAGRRIVYQPAAVVEHRHRGTIGRRVPKEFVRAVTERNRLLFAWKHLDEPELQRRHLAALYRQALDTYLEDRREDLVWLAFALERLKEALAARRAQDPARRTTSEILRVSRPAD